MQDVLDAYSKATGRNTLYSNELIEGKNSPGAQNASHDDALQQILLGTDLTFQMADNNTAVLKKKDSTEKQPSSKQQENNTEKSGRQQARMEMNLGEITVTAQKREENVQEVPISISVLDEFDIEDNDIKTISDIADYVPNFQQFSVGGAGMYTPSIRGLSAEVTATNSSSIGTYIDGVPYTNTRAMS
ncbi:TonB-dependent receptor plug domain-containing protein [uncultured Desulfobacter sp.]|uniref:STN domain-containing protein n=1 Tax=uncultured Desulfobacter sp. TaxID=240139 RepID=UPI0029F5237A|nr:TonB-dependent receptor plug domain-containing protein [uncultured Desulfobacter sp.]